MDSLKQRLHQSLRVESWDALGASDLTLREANQTQQTFLHSLPISILDPVLASKGLNRKTPSLPCEYAGYWLTLRHWHEGVESAYSALHLSAL
jgi:hypothetical protein